MANNKKIKTLALPSRVEANEVIILKSTLIKFMNEGATKIICNFSDTDFLSETGAEELANVALALHKHNGELGICGIKPAVKAAILQPHLFKFYSVEESVALVTLKHLVTYFEYYEDVFDIQVRMENAVPHIELYLGYAADQTMRQVQESVELIRHSLESAIKDAKVLIVPSTKLEKTSQAPPVHQKQQIVFSSNSQAVRQLAEAIGQTIPEDILCTPIQESFGNDSFDLTSVAFMLDNTTADAEATSYLQALRSQKVALFAVADNYPYSGYAGECMKNISALLDTSNTIVGKFVCIAREDSISEIDIMKAQNKFFDIIQAGL